MVEVDRKVNDVLDNVRKGLDITKASNFKDARQVREQRDVTHSAHSRISNASQKRSSSHTNNALPANKRPYSYSSSITGNAASENCIHHHIFISNYGKLIYRVSSCVALLNALKHYLIGQA
jgi:hypothetical protein